MAARKAERSTAAKDAKSAAPRREPERGQVISYQVVMDARRRPTLPADLLSSAHIDGRLVLGHARKRVGDRRLPRRLIRLTEVG